MTRRQPGLRRGIGSSARSMVRGGGTSKLRYLVLPVSQTQLAQDVVQPLDFANTQDEQASTAATKLRAMYFTRDLENGCVEGKELAQQHPDDHRLKGLADPERQPRRQGR